MEEYFNFCIPRDIKIIKRLNKNIDLSYKKEFSDWIILSNGKQKQADNMKQKFKNIVINPGCLYIKKNMYMFNVIARSIRDNLQNIKSLSQLKKLYPKDRIIYLYERESLINNIFSVKKICDDGRDKNIIRILGIKITLVRKVN